MFTTKNHSASANTRVLTNEIATDFALWFLRKARRSSSIELGRRASWADMPGFAGLLLKNRSALVGAKPGVRDLLESTRVDEALESFIHGIGQSAVLGQNQTPFIRDSC